MRQAVDGTHSALFIPLVCPAGPKYTVDPDAIVEVDIRSNLSPPTQFIELLVAASELMPPNHASVSTDTVAVSFTAIS